MDMGRRQWRSRRESVIADILEVSEDEGEGTGRMAVEGGPGQPSAPNVPAAAMKSIPRKCGGRRKAWSAEGS